jgi:hypothetical protein
LGRRLEVANTSFGSLITFSSTVESDSSSSKVLSGSSCTNILGGEIALASFERVEGLDKEDIVEEDLERFIRGGENGS